MQRTLSGLSSAEYHSSLMKAGSHAMNVIKKQPSRFSHFIHCIPLMKCFSEHTALSSKSLCQPPKRIAQLVKVTRPSMSQLLPASEPGWTFRRQWKNEFSRRICTESR